MRLTRTPTKDERLSKRVVVAQGTPTTDDPSSSLQYCSVKSGFDESSALHLLVLLLVIDSLIIILRQWTTLKGNQTVGQINL